MASRPPRHAGPVRAMAVLAVTGAGLGRRRFESQPGRAGPPRQQQGAGVTVMPDSARSPAWRTGGCWHGIPPLRRPAGPAELGRPMVWVRAVAVLADGRVITGRRAGAGSEPLRDSSQVIELTCSVTSLATAQLGPARSLVIVHQASGFSLWSFTA